MLFDVAVADGEASVDEIEAIRMISKSLKMSHKEFITAKTRDPKGKAARLTAGVFANSTLKLMARHCCNKSRRESRRAA